MKRYPNPRRQLNIWMVTVGEPLPLPGNRDRLWRAGIVSNLLAKRGHKVTWWSSTVDHIRKRKYFEVDKKLVLESGVSLNLIDGCLYSSNISLRRLLNHAVIGWKLAKSMNDNSAPDVIVCSFPVIEMTYAAARYARKYNVPMIVDVRDLWPDIFVEATPAGAKFVARLILSPYYLMTKLIFSQARSVVAVSNSYLFWGLKRASRACSECDTVLTLGYKHKDWSAETARVLDEKLQKLGVRKSHRLITFSGSFGATYDIPCVIRAAMEIYSEGNTDIRFVICGTGVNEKLWKKMAIEAENVSFLGWLEAEELSCLLNSRSHIGLAAYVSGAPQSVPNKIVEYLTAKLPIVSSLSGETRELLASGNFGVTYKAGDHKSLAENILRLIGCNLTLSEMAQNAEEYSLSNSPERTNMSYVTHIEKIADMNR